MSRFLHTHGRLQADFAVRLGLPRVLTDALGHSYERWDGKGVPDHVKGARIPLAVRIVTLADVVEVHHRGGGVEAARRVAERAGGISIRKSLKSSATTPTSCSPGSMARRAGIA